MAAEIEGGPNATPHVPEGTAIKSTGETGGTKFLREDGDGTSSWQAPSAHRPEGTAVQSTGETGGVKFLREDGDGDSSWQPITHPVSKVEFYVKWDDASNSTPAGKVTFSGAYVELEHDLSTPYLTQSVLDVGNHFANSGANTYGDVNFDADSWFTFVSNSMVKLTFGTEPDADKVFKVTIIG